MALSKVLADEMHRWPQVESAYWNDMQTKLQIDLLSEYIDMTRDVLVGQPWLVPPGMVEYLVRELVVRVLRTWNTGAESAEMQKRLLSKMAGPGNNPLGGA